MPHLNVLVMVVPRNLKDLTKEMAGPLISRGRLVVKVDSHFHCLNYIEFQAVASTPDSKVAHFPATGGLIVLCHPQTLIF